MFSNKEKFEEIKKKFQKDGLDRIHILTDFDRTLIRAFVGGQEVPSVISVLRDGSYLTPDYASKAHELYNKYRPLEDNENISKEERKRLMHEWWSMHFKLLIKSGLDKKDIEKAVRSDNIRLRDEFSELADFLKDNGIPLVIMSSTGLGYESISQKLKDEEKLHNNIHIISNAFEWDDKGKAIAVKKPIVHSANKDETLVRSFPEIFGNIRDRKNVILLGDSLDDVGMVNGFDYDNLLKIVFLNEKTEKKKDIYKEFYDVLILNDSSLGFVYSFLKDITK